MEELLGHSSLTLVFLPRNIWCGLSFEQFRHSLKEPTIEKDIKQSAAAFLAARAVAR